MDLDEFKTKYEHNALIKSLVQLIPLNIGSAIDAGAAAIISRVRAKRATIFFDDLSKTLIITDEMRDSDEFIHKFLITSRAALNTQNSEKIKLFARLLSNSSQPDRTLNPDIFDEYASTIDALNYREFILLSLLERHESANPVRGDETPASRVKRHWDSFWTEAQKELNCSESMLLSLLNRCARVGLFDLFQGRYWDPTLGMGELTQLFYEIKKFVNDKTAYA